MRSTLVKIMNNHYLKVLSKIDFKKQLNAAIFEILDDFKNEQELCDFINLKLNKDIPDDALQYKIFVKQDFNENQSAVIFLMKHALCDGVGFFNLLSGLQRDFFYSNLPYVRKRTFNETLKRYIQFPFSIIFMYQSLMLPRFRGTIFEESKNRKVEYVISDDYKLVDLKASSKKLCCTINDFFLASSCIAFKRLCDQLKLTDLSKFETLMIINQREPITARSQINLFNNFFGTNVTIDFKDENLFKSSKVQENFKALLSQFKPALEKVKYDDRGLGQLAWLKAICSITPDIVMDTTKMGVNFNNRLWSNISGQEKPIKIGKAFSDKIFFSSFLDSQSYLIANVLSHNGLIRLGLVGANNFDFREYMKIFNEVMRQLLSGK
ncbi:UNKNOWN [Stylonychia lemnae]|uniref:O-acyltransferase WSD1 C-terminal domain-containing protein n=1 Tax=Stylonychia lemnae TaxID=5949 RepID=A0A078AAB2_STYLE|nr:UNKNOWN [Stylonychia lemnae]|eukprot:CDW77743.1 UNKNOWN [Stylonychia lemnae]